MSRTIRSILFAPANLPELIRKMPKAGPDLAIVDLEDGTPPAEKVSARRSAGEALATLRADGWTGRMHVRVNGARTEWFADEIAWAAASPFDGVTLPKVDAVEDVEHYHELIRQHNPVEGFELLLGIETGQGVINIESILQRSHDAVGVYFGGEDYATSIGGVRSDSNLENLYPRARVALHAKVRGLSCMDQGVVSIRDEDRFRRECAEARGFGFTGKICVHPRQVELANELFQPTAEEIVWSRRVLAEYASALAKGRATPAIDGMMIDGPLVKRAEAIVALADA